MDTQRNKDTKKKLFVGHVVSDKMEKTIVVKVVRTFRDALVGKVCKSVKKYKVHDPEGAARAGDRVSFYEGKPASRTKFMYLEQVLEKAPQL